MKNFRKFGLVTLILVFALALGGVNLLTFNNINNKVIYAEDTPQTITPIETANANGISFVAQVVDRESADSGYNIYDTQAKTYNGNVISENPKESISDSDSENIKKYTASSFIRKGEKISENKYVMLKRPLTKDGKTILQNIYISFGYEQAEKDSQIFLIELNSVSITLNGKSLYTLPVSTYNDSVNNKKYYQQYFDLYYTEDIDNKPIAIKDVPCYKANEGLYTFTFTFRTKDSQTNTLSESQEVSYSFYVFRQESYSNSNEFIIDSTNKFDNSYKTKTVDENHYIYSPFIENTKKDIDIKDDTNQYKYYSYYTYDNRNELPKIIFDNSQFTVTVLRNYFAESSSFTVGNGITSLDANINYSVTTNDKNITTITFKNLGEYFISYQYIVNSTPLTMENTNDWQYESFNIKNEKLTIFGAQIYYALETTSEDELYDNSNIITYNPYITDYDCDISKPALEDSQYSLTINENTISAYYPKTNQGPVWFKYLGNIKSSSCYWTWNGTEWTGGINNDGIKYINGYKFSNNGIYLVKIDYTFTEYYHFITDNKVPSYKYETQYFCFEIKSETPYVEAFIENTEVNISNGYFTNNNIEIKVSPTEKGVFDSDVSLEIKKDDNVLNVYNGYSSINNIIVSEEGHYTAKLYYGPTFNGKQYAFSEFDFTIDKTYPTLILNENNLNDYVNVRRESFSVSCPDSDVINGITYRYATLTTGASVGALSGDKTLMQNGYKFNSLTAKLNYNPNTIISLNGLYLFSVTDKAGNTTERIIIVDKTGAYILQDPVQDNKNVHNIHTTDVTVWAGAYKVIDATNLFGENGITNKGNFNDYFDIDNKCFKVAINNNKSKITKLDEKKTSYPFDYTNLFSETGVKLIAPEDDGFSVLYYDIEIFDAQGNSLYKRVEINMDKSQGIIFASNEDRIYPNELTNKDTINFEFYKGEGNYEVVELTYKYYPFATEVSSTNNYPFSTTATAEGDLLAISSLQTNGKYLTSIINPINPETDNRTKDGYYIITRVYANGGEKEYCFTVDRNKIKDDMTYVNGEEYYRWGQDIYFTLGSDNYTSFVNNIKNLDNIEHNYASATYHYDNIGIVPDLNIDNEKGIKINAKNNFPSTYLIETNKMPVLLHVPEYKYNSNYGNSYTKNNNKLHVIFYELIRDYASNNDTLKQVTITKLDNNYKFTETKVYYVLIYDDAGNAMSFAFRISLTSPTGSWKTSNNNYTAEYATLDASENTIDFTFTNLTDITKADIDKDNITLCKIVNNERIEIIEPNFTVEKTYEDGTKTIYSIKNLDATEDCVYELTIQYKYNRDDYTTESPYGIYASRTYYLIIDKTKPTYSLYNQIEKDNFSLKQNYIDNYDVSDDYFFVVDSSFYFKTATEEYLSEKFSYYYNNEDFITNNVFNAFRSQLVKSETSKLYIRQLYLFDEKAINLPSLLPTDSNYSNYNVERDRLRFNEYDTENYTQILYDNNNNNYFSVNSFYEIIEIDEAGNYNNFVIYIVDSNISSVAYNKTTASLPETEENITVYQLDKPVIELNINSITFKNSKINDLYYTVDIIMDNETHTFNFTPEQFNLNYQNETQNFSFKENNSVITAINSVIQEYLNQEEIIENGGIVTLKVYSRIENKVLTYNFIIQGTKKLYISAEYTNNSIRLIIDKDENDINYIRKIYISKVINGTTSSSSRITLSFDDFMFNINNDKYYFDGSLDVDSVYFVEYEDRFYEDSKQKQVLLINRLYEDDNYEDRIYVNPEKSKTVGGVINTSDNVKFTYQSKLYSIKIEKNGLDITSSFRFNSNEDGKVTLTFVKPSTYNKVDNYSITLSYLGLDDEYSLLTYNFIINTNLPNIQLKDFISNVLLDAEENLKDIEEKDIALYTAQRVFISWDETVTDFNPTFKVYYYKNGVLANTTSDLYLTNTRSSFTDIGVYVIEQTNELNNTRIFKFEITEDTNLFYWILNDKTGEKLTPSKFKYKYVNEDKDIDMEIPFYSTTLTTSEYSVIQNVDKRLILDDDVDVITNENGLTIYVYHIYGNETHVYDAYVAIATIAKTERIINYANYKINNSPLTTPYSYYSETATITWNAYHLIYCNPITAYVSYNQDNFTEVTDYIDNEDGTYSLVLKNGGEYRFYFVDNAGNYQKFNINTVKETNYQTINLVNSVWLKIKAENETEYRNFINQEIFNTGVNINIWGTIKGTGFIQDSPIEYTATRNGKEVELSIDEVTNTLTVTDVGLYCITFKAIENVSGDENEIFTTIHFTILDNGEARSLYDYSTANSQSIYKVEKIVNDAYIDITEEILNYYKTSSLTHLFVSSQSIGTGKYRITVNDMSNVGLYGVKQFSYEVWINNENPAFETSREFGTASTGSVKVTINKGLIASQIGNCKLIITNYNTIDITTDDANALTELTLSAPGDYYFTLVSTSGQVLFSNKITINKKLSSVTIIVIVIVIIFAVIGLLVFLKLRTRMKVR